MPKFDPNLNPYADDLIRLSAAPHSRYSAQERTTLARIIASKLYRLTLVEPYYTDHGFSRWQSDRQPDTLVEIQVLQAATRSASLSGKTKFAMNTTSWCVKSFVRNSLS